MPGEPENAHTDDTQHASDEAEDSPQCRICLDGEDPELGRLIRPCLCKGSVSVSRVCSQSEKILNNACMLLVRTRKVSPSLAQYLCFE